MAITAGRKGLSRLIKKAYNFAKSTLQLRWHDQT